VRVSAAAAVTSAFRRSAGRLPAFTAAHLVLRLVASAVMIPLAGLALTLALSRSGQSALTDQDIALFLLTPAGFAGMLALFSLLIVAAVLDLAVMTNALVTGERTARGTLVSGIRLLVARLPRLVAFNVILVLRILLLAAPFLAAGGFVALVFLRAFDINYYLTYRPPDFLLAAGLIGLLLLALAALLLSRLAAWAVALHLVLFEGRAPWRAFGESAKRLHGSRRRIVTETALWAAVRLALGFALALVLGTAAAAIQAGLGANLRALAYTSLAIFGIWSLANAALAALSNGALAALLEPHHRATAPEGAPRPSASREAARRPLPALAVIVAAALLFSGGATAWLGETLDRVTADREVEIIAHRGAAASRPENTLAAVEQALRDRADWVEIDVQESADGEVIVAHDSDFMKLAGNPLKVWDATMADIAEIDIGSWFGPEWAGERTPTLRDVLRLAKGRGRVLIELKYYGHDDDLEARVARIVEEEGMTDAVAVMSLKYPAVRKMRALRPDWRHGVLAARAIGDPSALEADFLALNTGQVTAPLIRRAHEQGKQVYVWTVNDPALMSRMISLGVDGLITDEPALARQVMEARNALSGPERLILALTGRLRLESFDLVEDEADA
jgi:glycerophosphoryl diester phosphodiesterase